MSLEDERSRSIGTHIRSLVAGLTLGLGTGLGLGFYASTMDRPDLPGVDPKRVPIPTSTVAPQINYGYDPLVTCPQEPRHIEDNNIFLQQGSPVVIGGISIEARSGRLVAKDGAREVVSESSITIRTDGGSPSERVYEIAIGERVDLGDDLLDPAAPRLYSASVIGDCVGIITTPTPGRRP